LHSSDFNGIKLDLGAWHNSYPTLFVQNMALEWGYVFFSDVKIFCQTSTEVKGKKKLLF
jgi:hypothetical protein